LAIRHYVCLRRERRESEARARGTELSLRVAELPMICHLRWLAFTSSAFFSVYAVYWRAIRERWNVAESFTASRHYDALCGVYERVTEDYERERY